MPKQQVSRRNFLRITALTAGAFLASCAPATPKSTEEVVSPKEEEAVEPTPTTEERKAAEPTKIAEAPTAIPEAIYKEAPMLADLVSQGKLPPIDERLPSNPRIAKHGWQTPGVYGGVMQMVVSFEWGMSYYPVEGFCYGSSPLQYKDDGLQIVPGTLESFEFNADATELTLFWRKGLKWSDGTPWTTDDFMFWIVDFCQDETISEGIPGSLQDGSKKPAEISKVDDFTVKIKYASPTPLAIDRIAMDVKGIWGGNFFGLPAHYLKQFHPKYNTELKDTSELDKVMFMGNNPDMPTLNAWVVKKYEQGQRVVWERNPYYYVVDEDGNQLPYLDGFVNTNLMNGEVERLSYMEGKVDLGVYSPFGLADIPALKDAPAANDLNIFLWGTGSGTGLCFVLSQDYKDKKYRDFIENTKFRKALSHAINREEVLKVQYLGYGEMTTGTMSPKAIEWNVSDEGRQAYAAWRDSAVTFDPEQSKALLDELQLVDVNGDGWREFPDGSPMKITLDFSGSQGDSVASLEQIERDWKAVGINAIINPVPPDNFRQLYEAGQLMGYGLYEASDGPNCLIFPTHICPYGSYGWAPLQGRYLTQIGTTKEGVDKDKEPWDRNPPWRQPEPGSPIARLQALYLGAAQEPDALKRYKAVYDMAKIHVEEGPFMFGMVADSPQVVVCRKDLKNVPNTEDLVKHALGGFTGPWSLPMPGTYDPETFYFENPDQHKM